MEYIVDIEVEVRNGETVSKNVFKDESISVSRATSLWIENNSGKESDFYETLKLWHELDTKQGTRSYLKLKTSKPTQIENYKTYYIYNIDEKDQAIHFKWID